MGAIVTEAELLAGTTERKDQILENARRLCRLTLRNQQPQDAFSILLAALTELTRDPEFRAGRGAAEEATAAAARIFAELHAELLREGTQRPLH